MLGVRSIRAGIAAVLGVIGLLVAALFAITALQLDTAGDRVAAEDRVGESQRLAEGMRQSSNDLTRMVRLFVATGDQRYRDIYEEILAIRNGTAPRPPDYDNSYWDRVLAGDETTGGGTPEALTDVLRDAGFADNEFAALDESRQASDALAKIEIEVMDATAATATLPLDDREIVALQPLQDRLTDAEYYRHKGEIMASIEEFVSLVDQRTSSDVEDLQNRSSHLLWAQLALIALIAAVSAGAFWLAGRRVVRPLQALQGVTREIAAGDYHRRAEIRSVQELDDLADTFNEMADAVLRDIDARQAAEATAVAAQQAAERADEAKSYFLATMSHEIRTPLNAVLGMSEALRDTALDTEQLDCVDTISTSGEHLLSVINDVLDYSKIEAGMLELDPQVFDLRRCVEDALDVISGRAADKRLDLVIELEDDVPEVVRGDRLRIRQIVVNYLSNAVKFTEHGDILVKVTAVAAGENQHDIRVAVRDTGIGVPPDRLDRLFQSFSQVDASTTRRYGGTGLGLAICKRLAELMGGTVAVESAAGYGSTFSFTFRAESDPTWLPAARQDAEILRGKRLLVVDDNDTNRRILRASAATWGMEVRDTASPYEALGWIAAGERFDLGALDYMMPGMDGAELANALRRHATREELPLLLLSSVRMTSASVPAFSMVLTKPVRRLALLDAVVEAITGDAAEAGAAQETAAGDRAVSALRILVAEDNLANQKVATRTLQALGYTADIVGTGADAVAAVERNRYDVVLMDVHMPVMDGLEATRRIRRLPEDRRPHVFAMTASALDSERQECIDAGMERHIAKPISRDVLREALQSIEPGTGGPVAAAEAVEPTPPPEPTGSTDEVEADDIPGALVALADMVSAEGVVEILEAIIDDVGPATEQLRNAISAGDDTVVRRTAHTMKSNSATVGALSVSDDCAALEAFAKAADLGDEATELAATLDRTYTAMADELRVERDRWAAAGG